MHKSAHGSRKLIENFKALETAVELFDARYADFDFTSLSYIQLSKLEDRLFHYPAYKVKEAVYKARVAIANKENQESECKRQLLQERYGYYCPGEDITKGLMLFEIKGFECAFVQTVYSMMVGIPDEEIRKRIRKRIPTITDREIDEYRRRE